ncbi:hypothetical protein ACP70R_039072 [Stipagrostis hirtigluma subsp. patula]
MERNLGVQLGVVSHAGSECSLVSSGLETVAGRAEAVGGVERVGQTSPWMIREELVADLPLRALPIEPLFLEVQVCFGLDDSMVATGKSTLEEEERTEANGGTKMKELEMRSTHEGIDRRNGRRWGKDHHIAPDGDGDAAAKSESNINILTYNMHISAWRH